MEIFFKFDLIKKFFTAVLVLNSFVVEIAGDCYNSGPENSSNYNYFI